MIINKFSHSKQKHISALFDIMLSGEKHEAQFQKRGTT